MKPTLALALLVILSPWPAMACGPNEAEIFSCQIGKKQVQLCQAAGKVVYSFGKKGAPEILLVAPNATVRDKDTSTASGNEEDFHFTNKGTRYIVTHMSDQFDGSLYHAGVAVVPPAGEVVGLDCKEETVRFQPKAIRAKANEMNDIPRD